MPTLSERMAQFAFALDAGTIPKEVAECALDHILDAVGVGIAASSVPEAQGMHGAVQALGKGEEASPFGFPGRLPAPSAALLNGTLVHSLEFDDTHTASIVHGSAVIVAAAFAAAEKHGASGADLLAAVVAGWELMVRLGLAAPGAFQRRGFQVTAVGGPFIAALIAARLARRPVAEAVNAMGIAGSQGGGVFEFLSQGATVKSMHAGWAAHGGLVAAQLAAGGMTGPGTILEGTHGFYRCYAGDDSAPARLSAELDSLGRRWVLLEASLKGYPCCHYMHPFLECAERLRAKGLRAADVAAVECFVPGEEAMLICDPWERKLAPASGYDAKFSLPYGLALVLLDGEAGVRAFSGAADRRDALELARRVSWQPWSDSGFPQRFAGRVLARTKDGRVMEERVEQVRGSPERPFTREEIDRKFDANAALRFGADGARRLRERIRALARSSARDVLA
ncbi:MAG TPA: MmgE/PrpD family protein [Burkholderiales bacterium]|nr:MmgE/PrpD family protein [Burkholderiales bacterium]